MVIVLICLTLLTILMQSASWFSRGHQLTRSEQAEDLARTLTKQVAYTLIPLMESNDDQRLKIEALLQQLTDNSRILDASVYDNDGALVAHQGENIGVRDRLALDGQRAGSYFNHQIVQPLTQRKSPLGFLRVTLDTHVLVTESRQVDNTTNILRLMMLLALAIGIILTRTLLRDHPSHWQQSPFLLTASTPLNAEAAEENDLQHTSTTAKTASPPTDYSTKNTNPQE